MDVVAARAQAELQARAWAVGAVEQGKKELERERVQAAELQARAWAIRAVEQGKEELDKERAAVRGVEAAGGKFPRLYRRQRHE